MRIQNNPSIQQIMKAYGKSSPKTSKVEGTKFEEDKIEISTQAREIQVAMKALKKLPEVREEKVSQLRSQIQNGTYRPTAEDVIEKLAGRLENKQG